MIFLFFFCISPILKLDRLLLENRPSNQPTNKSIKKYGPSQKECDIFFSYFVFIPGCAGQFAYTMTNFRTHWTLYKPSRQVRHRGDDRRVRWAWTQEAEAGKPCQDHWTTSLGAFFLILMVRVLDYFYN
jgi:hypothetical protein